MVRHGDPAYASLSISLLNIWAAPLRTGQSEHPAWSTSLIFREETGADLQSIGAQELAAPAIKYGRVVEPLWLRLQRAQGMFRAATSRDGITWSELAAVHAPAGKMAAGIFLSSGLGEIATEVRFDSATLAML